MYPDDPLDMPDFEQDQLDRKMQAAKARHARIDKLMSKVKGTRQCVVCGKDITNDQNHKCTAKALCTYRSRMRKKSEAAEESRTFYDRLSEGFSLTKGNE